MKKIGLIWGLVWLITRLWIKPPTANFLNVGQGLAVLYQNQTGFTMLYDTGPESAVGSELGAILPPWQRQLDLVIISHAHADHLNGLLYLLDSYQIRELWLPPPSDNELGQTVRQKLSAYPEIKIRERLAGDWLVLPGGVSLALWHPSTGGQDEHAATQVVSLEDRDHHRLLLTGDLDAADETNTLAYCQARATCAAQTTILQVSHHGSKFSTSDRWLEATKPDRAVISVGENSYGHPATETMERLMNHGIPTKRTDQDGRVLTWLSLQR